MVDEPLSDDEAIELAAWIEEHVPHGLMRWPWSNEEYLTLATRAFLHPEVFELAGVETSEQATPWIVNELAKPLADLRIDDQRKVALLQATETLFDRYFTLHSTDSIAANHFWCDLAFAFDPVRSPYLRVVRDTIFEVLSAQARHPSVAVAGSAIHGLYEFGKIRGLQRFDGQRCADELEKVRAERREPEILEACDIALNILRASGTET